MTSSPRVYSKGTDPRTETGEAMKTKTARFDSATPQHWAIRLRCRLLIPGTHRWNGWVRGVTAWIERRPEAE